VNERPEEAEPVNEQQESGGQVAGTSFPIDRRTFLWGLGAAGGFAALGPVGRLGKSVAIGKAASLRAAALSGGGIVYAQSEAVENTDIAYDVLVYPSAEEVTMTTYDRLVTFDSKMNLVPQLATSWRVAADKVTWTFDLRKGVKFSDGSDLNADAVVSNALRDTNPLNANTEWTSIYSRWRAVGPYTVQLTTHSPFSGVLNYLAKYEGGIVSPQTPKGKVLHPVGCGPYSVSTFNPGASTTVQRVSNYWAGPPALENITFRYVPDGETALSMLEAGEAQVMDNVLPVQAKSIEAGGTIQLLKALTARSFFIEFNLLRPIFQDLRVRQALNYAVDTKAIISAIWEDFAEVMKSPASQTLPGYTPVGEYSYDPAKASALLSAAGWVRGSDGVLAKDGMKLSFNLTNGEGQFPQGDLVCQAVQAYLNKIGCQVTIREIPAASFFASLLVPRDKQELDTVLFGFNPSNGMMAYVIRAMWLSNPTKVAPYSWNVSWYSNSSVDRWLSQLDEEFEVSAQNALLARIQKQIWDDAPAIWLYTPYQLSAASRSVEGVYVLPIVYTIVRNARVATA